MEQYFFKKNTPKPTLLSHSRSISTIPNHQKSISFMPKFLLKTLHRRKKSNHQRSFSNSTIMNGNKNHKDHGIKNDEIKVETIKRIDKHVRKNKQLMQLIPVPRRVTSMMSMLFRNKKQRDQEQCKEHTPRNLAKQGSKKSRSKEVACNDASSSTKNCKVGVGNVVSVTVNSVRISRVKSVRKIGENVEEKEGLKIKRIIKMKSRDKEKRFELCKKKILMGEKCRPLHGSLNYDKNGVLVPEDFT